MYSKFDAIIFDLGGVVLNLDYQLTIDAFKKLGLEDFEAMYTQAKQSDLFDRFETGQISSQHFINKLFIIRRRIIEFMNFFLISPPVLGIFSVYEVSHIALGVPGTRSRMGPL